MFSSKQVDSSNLLISKERRRSFVKSNTQTCEQNNFKIFEDEISQKKDKPSSFKLFLSFLD
jgi:hypothetical protein